MHASWGPDCRADQNQASTCQTGPTWFNDSCLVWQCTALAVAYWAMSRWCSATARVGHAEPDTTVTVLLLLMPRQQHTGYQAGGRSNGTSGGSAISAAGWRFNICQDKGRCRVEPADGISQWYRRMWLVSGACCYLGPDACQALREDSERAAGVLGESCS